MSGINKVILVGNLGKDPEVRHLEGGAVVAKFPLATSETYKTKEGQRVDQTEWHNIVMWRGLAESAEKYLRKGSLVYVEGKIRTRSWDDKDGNKRFATEIIADTMTMLSSRRPDDHHQQNTSEQKPAASDDSSSVNVSGNSGDDLPF
ncbi:MAG: single-stranded DNA-binding protein [Bacteroidota bacterium]|nr:single-stranded DNA-binding protein [Bacteroidota bacterium]